MQLTDKNYFSTEADANYMSASQFKNFMSCEAKALAQLNGDYPRTVTTAMLVGSAVDAMIEGTYDAFAESHPEMISTRGSTKGELKTEFKKAIELFERINADPFFMSYLEGDKQTILTGTISGVPFKAKLDVLHPARIVDFKTTADFKKSYSPEVGAYVTFGEYWRYDIQGAIYQELVKQQFTWELPFYLAAVTKEPEPDLAVLSIPDDSLKFALDEVEAFAPRFQAIKMGFTAPTRCGKCDYCKRTKKLTEVIDYREIN